MLLRVFDLSGCHSYLKQEVTGGLDERLTYLRELEDRRAAILSSIAGQGKPTPELSTLIEAAASKHRALATT